VGRRMFLHKSSHKIAITVNVRMTDAEAKSELFGVGCGLHDEIVFELTAASVIHQVDSGIKAAHLKTAIIRNGRAPFIGIVAMEDAGGGTKPVNALDFRIACRAVERQANGLAAGVEDRA